MVVGGGQKDVPDGDEEDSFEEEDLQTNGAYQLMIFHPVLFEGDIGKELTRRNDRIAKRFLARYHNN